MVGVDPKKYKYFNGEDNKMIYYELESMVYNKEVCLFGGGIYGKTRGYDYVTAFGLKVDFYCDNNIAPGTIIRDGIEVRDIQYLYENKERIQVFLVVSRRYQSQIMDQLKEHGIDNIIIVDFLFISQLLDSIDASDDELIKQRCYAIYNDTAYLEKCYENETGFKLDLNNPRTFNEKLQWLKLYDRKPEYTRMVDKYEAKQFVEERIGSGYTIPTLGVWDSFDEIDFDKLPEQFVLKCTHDSGSMVFVRDKDKLDKEETKKYFDRRLAINYFWGKREWVYKNVKRRILAEPYLCDSSENELKDYKFFCFQGNVKMIEVDFDRFIDHKRNIYNKKWEYMPFTIKYPTEPERVIEPPKCLAEMIMIAKKLSLNIPHVRIDFYLIDDKPIVGEMTFFHESGMGKFIPSGWDEIFGDWIQLPEIKSAKE